MLACRDRARGLAAERAILAADPGARATYLPLDLASGASVRAFVEAFLRLDGGAPAAAGLALLLCSAGAVCFGLAQGEGSVGRRQTFFSGGSGGCTKVSI